jgi:RNase P subunit RPR2
MTAWQLGNRTLLAISCLKCGALVQGDRVDRRARKLTDPRPYVDRRCGGCKWGAKVKARATEDQLG